MDVIGQTFERWTVLDYVKGTGVRAYYTCVCRCGKQKSVMLHSLLSGRSTSCGCLSAAMMTQRMLTRNSRSRRLSRKPMLCGPRGLGLS